MLLIAGAAAIVVPKINSADGGQVAEDARRDARLAAQRYLEALAQGQASAALGLAASQPSSTQFLTDAVLQHQIAGAPITGLMVDSADTDGAAPPDAQRVIIAAQFGDTLSQASVWLRKKADQWRLDNSTASVPLGPAGVQNESLKAVAVWGVPTNGVNPITVFPGILQFSSSNRLVDITSPPVPVLLDSLTPDAPAPTVRLTATLNDAGRQSLNAAMEARVRRCYAGGPPDPNCPHQRDWSPMPARPISPTPGRFTNMAYNFDPLTMQVHVTGTGFWTSQTPDDTKNSFNSIWDVSKDPPVFVRGGAE
ncbi:hypothetical protein [Mycobacterium sp. IS-1264]|uniref:hypothetical protein n=1 Tax=Mycobacterium sp. IS-1264 TaxID=1834158 RepID=UPI0011159109|nr:hypothetical protein [Mycobacterium sp. IS-1264]